MTRPRRIDPEGKRAAILAAAQALFAEQGFEGTVIARVAARAEVAVGTVHRIFGDKTGLLLAAQADIEHRFIAAMRAGWATDAPLRQRFEAMLRALFDEMIRLRTMMPLMALRADPAAHPRIEAGGSLRGVIAELVQDAMARGEFRPVPVQPVAEIAFGMVDAAMRATIERQDLAQIPAYVSVIADMLVTYLERDRRAPC